MLLFELMSLAAFEVTRDLNLSVGFVGRALEMAWVCLLEIQDWVMELEGGMAGIDDGFDDASAIGIASEVVGMMKTPLIKDSDSEIEKFERLQLQAILYSLMRSCR
jgi:hypothetical protein